MHLESLDFNPLFNILVSKKFNNTTTPIYFTSSFPASQFSNKHYHTFSLIVFITITRTKENMLDHKTHQPTNSFHLSDGTRHRTNTYHDVGVVVVDDESGICSPPLWKTSPPMSPRYERDNDDYYRSLSPNSRTQAIVKGQRELMDMVKNMPETHYELSLKDIVEHQQQKVDDPREEKRVEKKKSGSGRRVVVLDKVASVKRKNGVKVDHGDGFYLKMVFPFTLGSKDKKKKVVKKKESSNSVNNGSSKVTPKPSGSEKEWWKKSLTGSKESDSSVSSNNSRSIRSSSGRSIRSNSSNSSRHEKMSGGCWYFIQRPKSQTKKIKDASVKP